MGAEKAGGHARPHVLSPDRTGPGPAATGTCCCLRPWGTRNSWERSWEQLGRAGQETEETVNSGEFVLIGSGLPGQSLQVQPAESNPVSKMQRAELERVSTHIRIPEPQTDMHLSSNPGTSKSDHGEGGLVRRRGVGSKRLESSSSEFSRLCLVGRERTSRLGDRGAATSLRPWRGVGPRCLLCEAPSDGSGNFPKEAPN